jgi:hypothetical protein
MKIVSVGGGRGQVFLWVDDSEPADHLVLSEQEALPLACDILNAVVRR